MGKLAEFFFDVGSPAAYLAWTQLPALCAETGAELVYRPMLLGGVFHSTGNASPTAIAAKGRYVSIDYGRFARRYGVPLVINPHFPINTLTLMRALTGVQRRQPERFAALLAVLFRALWIDAVNLNDPALAAQTLTQGSFDPPEILALAAEPETKAALKETTDEAVRRGVFGAPTTFVGEEMFFGQDRLDFIAEALA